MFGLSQNLWGQVPLEFLQGYWQDRDEGWMRGDDFTNFAADAAISSSVGYYKSEGNDYKSFEVRGTSATTVQGIQPLETPWTVPSAWNVYSPGGGAILIPGNSYVPTPGALKFACGAAADQMQLQLAADQARASNAYSHGLFTPYLLGNNSGVAPYQGKVLFECRMLISNLNNGGSTGGTASTSFFVGLASTLATATSVPVGASSYSGTPSYLGFGCLDGDLAGDIGLVYSIAGTTPVTQATVLNGITQAATVHGALNLFTLGGVTGPTTAPTGFPTIPVAGAGGIPTTTPSTYVGAYFKLGFVFDPKIPSLTPYLNGVPFDGRLLPNKSIGAQSIAGVTQTATTNCIGTQAPAGANWPAAPMTFAAGIYQTGTAYQTMTIDWWRCCQLKS